MGQTPLGASPSAARFGTMTMTCALLTLCTMTTLWSTPSKQRMECLRSSTSFTDAHLRSAQTCNRSSSVSPCRLASAQTTLSSCLQMVSVPRPEGFPAILHSYLLLSELPGFHLRRVLIYPPPRCDVYKAAMKRNHFTPIPAAYQRQPILILIQTSFASTCALTVASEWNTKGLTVRQRE